LPGVFVCAGVDNRNVSDYLSGINNGATEMTNFKYFADINGETIELVGYELGMSFEEFAKKFPGVKGKRRDGYSMRTMRAVDGRELPVTRSIEYKSNPSKHVCDARCLNATGKVMKCECACGGKNHGKGHA
jgi:hypothetical protein